MVTINLEDERIYRRLQQIAEQEQRSVEAVLDDMLDLYEAQETDPLTQMAAAADALGLKADRNDIAAKFDDLLRETWMQDDDSDQRSG